MNISLALSVVVFVVGALFFIYSNRPSLKELGRLAFAVGLLAALLQIQGGVSVSLFHR